MVSIMNRLDIARRVAVVKALVEGNSIRATVRMTGVAKNTVQKLVLDLGQAVAGFQSTTLRDLNLKRVQVDEIWSFCYAKKKTVQKDPSILERNADAGDVWTFTALDANSKLCVSWLVGNRTAENAYEIMSDIRDRVSGKIQLTTDQLSIYLRAVDQAFIGTDIDYGMLHKIYKGGGDGRYSPAECIGAERKPIIGDPNPKHISTSFVERQNLTMRMSMRRYTRLTNAFSRKIENHAAMVALYFMYYNFGRVHQTLRVTPAMEAGVTDHVWSVEEIVALLA
jgi:IS1 family transposase